MSKVVVRPAKLSELSWLLEVKETGQPLTDVSPIWVRKDVVKSGMVVPGPECHLYCEFGIVLSGRGLYQVEKEKAEDRPGDVFLGEPGVPHWGRILKYPRKSIVVYFLPSVLIEMGPESEGAKILHRFTGSRSLKQRLLRPPPGLRRELIAGFEEIAEEFKTRRFGREIRLRTLLMELLVKLLRWEEKEGNPPSTESEADWKRINKVLQYLREHYTEPLYAEKLALATGMSKTHLKVLFHSMLGMSWVKYLQAYRIHRAAALLSEPGFNVTETAFAVGFESLSHFNSVFHAFMGVSPREYGKRGMKAGKVRVSKSSARDSQHKKA
jgi:AraC-like DNA-binding protein